MIIEPISVSESVATAEERAKLGLFTGEMVYRLDGIRRSGEHPFVENIRLPAALFPSLQNPVARIGELADRYGLQLGEAQERVCAVAASADNANALGVTVGTVLLVLDRVVHLRDGRPAEWRIAYCPDQKNIARLKARLEL
jgi:GntR family transcriptional regulator